MTIEFSANATKILQARYLRRDAQGEIAETPEEMLHRVARGVAQAEVAYASATAAEQWTGRFYELMSHLDFLPNSPTLMNAGTPMGQLSACFVLPVGDSMDEIFDALKLMALVQQTGGGTGFSFSRLRPQGSLVASTGGTASGPVSFMRIFDCATENIRQGGKRRGANMGVLRCDHPDILEFVDAKLDGTSFSNFNLSVAATDAFMEAAAADQSIVLRHPKSGQAMGRLPAAQLMQRIAHAAWTTGDPGLIFLDAINRAHPTPALGEIEATNPCGEVPLLPYEACNLGSINLSHMVREDGNGRRIDWEKLAETVHIGLRFLDNVIDVGRWPSPQIADVVRGNRKVGLGVMGFAETLILLGIPYDAPEAVNVAEELMQFIAQAATAASRHLAEERGVFPNWEQSIHAQKKLLLRNAAQTSIAPTGTISILAGTSASIEPLFALAYQRRALDLEILTEVNPLVLRHARQHGFYSQELVEEIEQRGSLKGSQRLPPEFAQLFRTALEIAPEVHLRMQAAFQRHVDNAVSKTINLPQSAAPEDIASMYSRAWELGLKGITVYRYGSKGQQVLTLGTGESPPEHEHFARCDPHACKL